MKSPETKMTASDESVSSMTSFPTSKRFFLVLISPDKPGQLPENVIHVTDQTAVVEGNINLFGFLLQGLSEAEQNKAVSHIRQSQYWVHPVYTDNTNNKNPLLDGHKTLVEAMSSAQQMQELLISLKLDPQALQTDEKIMLYQYIREQSELRPVLDRNSKRLYRYPVIDVLSKTEELADIVLIDLLKRQTLIPRTLLDRTRECPHCGSAHPHFIDVCPQCESIEIHKTAALHCFTCGHVGPETDFQSPSGMLCPQCNTRLRHIGVDYDRPLTQYACQSCHHIFIEPKIRANCLDCGSENLPEQLIPHDISTLVLSVQGRMQLRSGASNESFTNVKTSNYVVGAYFRQTIAWSLSIQERHPDIGFGLVLFNIQNAQEIIEQIGALRAYALFDEISLRISELQRDSDLATRFGEYGLWIFLPMSSAEGFANRLKGILSTLNIPQQSNIQAEIHSLQCPQDIIPKTTVNDVMAKLSKKVQKHVG